MYLMNQPNSKSKLNLIMKNGDESLVITDEMLKYASDLLKCTPADVRKCIEGTQEQPKDMHDILMERAKKSNKL